MAALLREQRHTVYAPSLTGVGDRVHLLDRRLTAATHVQDIIRGIRFEDGKRDIRCLGDSNPLPDRDRAGAAGDGGERMYCLLKC